MYTPKVSETHKTKRTRFQQFLLQKFSLRILKGGCSGKATPKTRYEKFARASKGYADGLTKYGTGKTTSQCSLAQAAIKTKGRDILAAERTLTLPKETWKEYVCFVSSASSDTVWEVRYAGYEPGYSKYKDKILESLNSLKLP